MRKIEQSDRYRPGFTLIELLVVIGILSAAVATIGACLHGGIRVLERARQFNRFEVVTETGLSTLQKDIQNAVQLYAIPFEGGEDSLELAGVLVRVDEEGREEESLGTVKYSFDSREKTLLRKSWPFPGSEPYGKEHDEKVMRDLKSIELEYMGMGDDGDIGSWQSSWTSKTNLPAAVKVTVTIDDGIGDHVLRRVILAPVFERERKKNEK